jgi:hypothetical protein
MNAESGKVSRAITMLEGRRRYYRRKKVGP